MTKNINTQARWETITHFFSMDCQHMLKIFVLLLQLTSVTCNTNSEGGTDERNKEPDFFRRQTTADDENVCKADCSCLIETFTNRKDPDDDNVCNCHCIRHPGTPASSCCQCLEDRCPCGVSYLEFAWESTPQYTGFCSPCCCKCGKIYDGHLNRYVCRACGCPCGTFSDGYGNSYCRQDCSNGDNNNNINNNNVENNNDNDNGCFPSTARVSLDSGKSITMSELRVGDRVKTGDNNCQHQFSVMSGGITKYSEVKAFLNKHHDSTRKFLSIQTSFNKTVSLTGNHLIYVRRNRFIPIYANEVSIGDEVLVHENNELTPATVIKMSTSVMQGVYGPLTENGNIIVDGVLASCYASFDHDVAQVGMTPMRWLPDIIDWILGEKDESPEFVVLAKRLARQLVPSQLN